MTYLEPVTSTKSLLLVLKYNITDKNKVIFLPETQLLLSMNLTRQHYDMRELDMKE